MRHSLPGEQLGKGPGGGERERGGVGGGETDPRARPIHPMSQTCDH